MLSCSPYEWKTSIVSALHKKGSREQLSNYRPMALTCVVCKILESILRDKLLLYLVSNNLISDKQFGFVKGRFVELQLLNLSQKIVQSLDQGNQMDILYLDFEKAFDKIPHNLLLFKLKNFVSDKLLSWIIAEMNF